MSILAIRILDHSNIELHNESGYLIIQEMKTQFLAQLPCCISIGVHFAKWLCYLNLEIYIGHSLVAMPLPIYSLCI